LFETLQSEAFDIVVADGVLHHTADTFAALRVCTERLAPGGTLVFGLVNVWGTFWWFRWARILTSVMGGSDFHKRARWGQRLFTTVRKSQEGTKRSSFFFRSAHSWAYDWFGNPRWNLHSPAEVRQWMRKLRLTHRQSLPSIMKKQNSRNAVARLISFITGPGPAFMSLFWLVNREPNMFYVVVTRPTSKDG
jgi:SAM-dependent methyltransferase